MRVRKRTTCSHCRTRGQFRLLELMWRLDGGGPWTWIQGFLCAQCRSAFLDLVGELGAQVVAIDG